MWDCSGYGLILQVVKYVKQSSGISCREQFVIIITYTSYLDLLLLFFILIVK